MTGAGKIIAVTGPPAAGTSTVAKALAARYGAVLFTEDPETFPDEVRRGLEPGGDPFAAQVWFRDLHTANQRRAAALSARGRASVLDTFWLTDAFYVEAHSLTLFERNLLRRLSLADLGSRPWPDLVVYLKASAAGTRARLDERVADRRWERDAAFRKALLAALGENIRFFGNLKRRGVLVVDRERLDLRTERGLEAVGRMVDRALKLKKLDA